MKKLFVILSLLAGSAHAEFFTGNQLLSKMNGNNMDQMVALGYVIAIADAQASILVCLPPDGVTAGQTSDVVKLFLERNPDRRHMTADVLVISALGLAWPCAGNRNSNTPRRSL